MKTSFISSILLIQSIFSFSQNPLNLSYKGESDGEKIYYYPNGNIYVKCTLVNGNLQGKHINYHKNGTLSELTFFDNGEFDGTNFSLNQKGDTVATETYKHDTLIHYKDFMYYKSGALYKVRDVSFSYSLRKNPFPKLKSWPKSVIYNVNILIQTTPNTGIYKAYYESGQLRFSTFAVKEKWDGPYIEYHENGIVKISTGYSLGNLDGEYIEYNKKGEIIKREKYKNGRKI